jgi:hypothetical protein
VLHIGTVIGKTVVSPGVLGSGPGIPWIGLPRSRTDDTRGEAQQEDTSGRPERAHHGPPTRAPEARHAPR